MKVFPMWVIYKNPRDFLKGDQGDLFVARRRYIGPRGVQAVEPNETCAVSTLEECRQRVRVEAAELHDLAVVCLPRDPHDDPVIVESWL